MMFSSLPRFLFLLSISLAVAMSPAWLHGQEERMALINRQNRVSFYFMTVSEVLQSSNKLDSLEYESLRLAAQEVNDLINSEATDPATGLPWQDANKLLPVIAKIESLHMTFSKTMNPELVPLVDEKLFGKLVEFSGNDPVKTLRDYYSDKITFKPDQVEALQDVGQSYRDDLKKLKKENEARIKEVLLKNKNRLCSLLSAAQRDRVFDMTGGLIDCRQESNKEKKSLQVAPPKSKVIGQEKVAADPFVEIRRAAKFILLAQDAFNRNELELTDLQRGNIQDVFQQLKELMDATRRLNPQSDQEEFGPYRESFLEVEKKLKTEVLLPHQVQEIQQKEMKQFIEATRVFSEVVRIKLRPVLGLTRDQNSDLVDLGRETLGELEKTTLEYKEKQSNLKQRRVQGFKRVMTPEQFGLFERLIGSGF